MPVAFTRMEITWRLLQVNAGDNGVNRIKTFVETSPKTIVFELCS